MKQLIKPMDYVQFIEKLLYMWSGEFHQVLYITNDNKPACVFIQCMHVHIQYITKPQKLQNTPKMFCGIQVRGQTQSGYGFHFVLLYKLKFFQCVLDHCDVEKFLSHQASFTDAPCTTSEALTCLFLTGFH